MNENDQRIAIAEACGWKRTDYQSASLQIRADVPFWTDGKQFCQAEHLRDYLHDLNAMHEAEKTLPQGQQVKYAYQVSEIVCPISGEEWELLHATAAQRAEAFLRTIGKWVES